MSQVRLCIFLLFTSSCLFAQSITPKEVMGTWKVTNVSLNKNTDAVPQKAQELKDIFTEATFIFKGNGVFELELQNTSSELGFIFKELTDTNWILKENEIQIGYDSDLYSYMRIQVDKGTKTLFRLPMIQLEVTKTEDAKPKKFKKLKSKYPKARVINQLKTPVFKTKEFSEDAIVPYGIVDTPPLIGNCKVTNDSKEMRDCTSMNVSRFVNRKFNTEIVGTMNFSGTSVIRIKFIIDTDGSVYNIEATSSQPEFAEEGKRVVGLLPSFTPAKHQGKAVAVAYTLPITFKVAN